MPSTMTLEHAHRHGFDLVQEHSARFVAYVRSLTPEQLAQPVPGLTWTAGETVAHVRSVYERYTSDRRRASTTEELVAQNHQDVERLGVDIDAAAASIEAQVDLLGAVVDHVDPTRTFPFHAGAEITMAGGWGNLLGELLVHGDDIARATGTTFTVPGSDLEVFWRETLQVLGGWLRAESRSLDESWDLDMPFGTVRITFADGGYVHAAPEPRPLHRTIEVSDVTAWTLTFPYRRRPFTDPSAALLASRIHDL